MPSSTRRPPSTTRPLARRGGSQLGPTGLLIIGVVVVAWLLDQQFHWGLFPDDATGTTTPAAVTRTAGTTGTTTGTTAGTTAGTNGGSAAVPSGLPDDAEAATIVRVADGDTVTVDIEGEQVSVRMIGIDTPETYVTRTGYKECYGQEASTFVKDHLVPGTVVFLDMDVTDTDRYDRLLRYIWVDASVVGADPAGEAVMVNEVLVEDGFAIPYPYAPDNREQPRFQAAAADAEGADRGIWCACGGERIPIEQTTPGCAAPVAVAGLRAA